MQNFGGQIKCIMGDVQVAYLYTTSNRLSEANPTMVKTKSSHIASMYDDLYHKFFFTSLKFVNPWLFRHLRPREDKSTSY